MSAVIFGGSILLHAKEIRVTTFRLSGMSNSETVVLSADAEDSLVRSAAEALNATDADVIVLRDVRDRQLCQRIAERLRGGAYGVVACSDFAAPANLAGATPQVAILSRSPAFAAWTESWKQESAAIPTGGFAFTSIQFGDADVCVYAVQSKNIAAGGNSDGDGGSARLNYEPFLRHLAGQASGAGIGTNVRARAFIIAGDFEMNSAGRSMAFEKALGVVRPGGFHGAVTGGVTVGGLADAASDIVFLRNVTLGDQTRIVSSAAPGLTAVTYPLVAAAPAATEPSVTDLPSSSADDVADRARRVFIGSGVAVGVILLAWLSGRAVVQRLRIERPSSPSPSNANFSTALSRTTYVNRLATDSAPAGQISQAPTETSSSDVPLWRQRALEAELRAEEAKGLAKDRLMPHLARMMKDKLLWRLLAQRSRTIQVHDASARVVAELEQRLALIQSHFESRVQSYENRIAELERDLAAKESINRELLESKVQVARLAVEQASPLRPKPSVVYTLRFGDLMARKATVKTRTRQESDLF